MRIINDSIVNEITNLLKNLTIQQLIEYKPIMEKIQNRSNVRWEVDWDSTSNTIDIIYYNLQIDTVLYKQPMFVTDIKLPTTQPILIELCMQFTIEWMSEQGFTI